MEKLVSVIIPTYKRKEKLIRAIKSVLVQNYKNFEVLVVNDDNKDVHLEEEILKFKDDRLRILNNKGVKGANGSRNTGIQESKGFYLAFLDDDDEWMPNYLDSKIKILDNTENSVGLALCNYFIQKKNKWKEYKITTKKGLFTDYFTGRISIGSSSNIFIKREVVNKIGLWDNELLRRQDVEFLRRVFSEFEGLIVEDFNFKVYGHNPPNPMTAYNQSNICLKKTEKFIENLGTESRKDFFSNHFRQQAKFLIYAKEYKKGLHNWHKSLSFKYFSIKNDLKLVKAFIETIF